MGGQVEGGGAAGGIEAAGAKLVGLGTPATRADVIDKLFSHGYIVGGGKELHATEKGLYLLKQLQADAALAKIADVAQTTAWEEALEKDPSAFEAAMVLYITSCIEGGVKEAYQGAAIGKCPTGLSGRGAAVFVQHLERDKRRGNYGS
jgi:hypothetical protein